MCGIAGQFEPVTEAEPTNAYEYRISGHYQDAVEGREKTDQDVPKHGGIQAVRCLPILRDFAFQMACSASHGSDAISLHHS